MHLVWGDEDRKAAPRPGLPPLARGSLAPSARPGPARPSPGNTSCISVPSRRGTVHCVQSSSNETSWFMSARAGITPRAPSRRRRRRPRDLAAPAVAGRCMQKPAAGRLRGTGARARVADAAHDAWTAQMGFAAGALAKRRADRCIHGLADRMLPVHPCQAGLDTRQRHHRFEHRPQAPRRT